MEVSALKYSGGIGLHGRSPLLRLQSDERLVAFTRRGNANAFEVLVGRYEAACWPSAAICSVRVRTPRTSSRTRSRRPTTRCSPTTGRSTSAPGCTGSRATAASTTCAAPRPSASTRWTSTCPIRRETADKVHERETFRLLVHDINDLPETQRTALVLREMDALSYDQIAEAMETTVPSVKSLLVRARVSLAEAAEARLLTCDEVRIELGELAEGLIRKPSPPVRRHLKTCTRCSAFQNQLKKTNKALAAMLPLGPLVLLKKLLLVHFVHFGHSAGAGAAGAGTAGATTGAGAATAGATAAGAGAATAGAGAVASSATGLVSAGVGALATKAAAGIAAAALVTAGAVAVGHHVVHAPLSPTQIAARQAATAAPVESGVAAATGQATIAGRVAMPSIAQRVTTTLGKRHHRPASRPPKLAAAALALAPATAAATTAATTTAATTTAATTATTTPRRRRPPPRRRRSARRRRPAPAAPT